MRIPSDSSRATAALRVPPRASPVRRQEGDAATPGSVTHLSTAAEVVLGLRAQASTSSIRPGAVAQIRADLAAGSIGTPEDLDATVDALLVELA